MKSIAKRGIDFYKGRSARRQVPKVLHEKFSIKKGYHHRFQNDFFDDTASEDGWQREVYEAALNGAREIDAKTVFDVGCGSGHKLIKYFENYRTVGFDLEPTLSFLKKKYPDREWRESNLANEASESADIVICADVIEHIPDPDILMQFLGRIEFSLLYLSTPERQLLYGFNHNGPPYNAAHCREWTFDELKAYVGSYFKVEKQVISNRYQCTQMIVCSQKR